MALLLFCETSCTVTAQGNIDDPKSVIIGITVNPLELLTYLRRREQEKVKENPVASGKNASNVQPIHLKSISQTPPL
jgi:hypothetical protein